jgi:hypothetical protein
MGKSMLGEGTAIVALALVTSDAAVGTFSESFQNPKRCPVTLSATASTVRTMSAPRRVPLVKVKL